jgi:hypothetical protein
MRAIELSDQDAGACGLAERTYYGVNAIEIGLSARGSSAFNGYPSALVPRATIAPGIDPYDRRTARETSRPWLSGSCGPA